MIKKLKLTVSDLALSAMFCAITAVLAQIAVPLPFTPVPVTLSTAGVLLSAVSLNMKRAVLSQILYLFMGALGLPVFHGFRGGIGMILGPTGGYIIAYVFMALVTGSIFLLIRKNNSFLKTKKFVRLAIYFTAMLPAVIICYILGCLWFSLLQGISLGASFISTVAPFIPADIFKVLLCAIAADYISARVK